MVPAVYEAVPFSYLWTSVAWHGPVTVGLGLFLLPRLMERGTWPRRALSLAALGAGWGVWTTWAWADPGFAPLSAGAFAGYAAATTCVMALGYGLLALARWPAPHLPRWASYALMCPSLVLFVVQGLTHPLGGLGLAVLLGLLVLALARLGRAEATPPANALRNWAALPLLPLAAAMTYATVLTTGPPLGAEDLIFLSFTILLGVWIVGIIRGLRALNMCAFAPLTRTPGAFNLPKSDIYRRYTADIPVLSAPFWQKTRPGKALTFPGLGLSLGRISLLRSPLRSRRRSNPAARLWARRRPCWRSPRHP